ncbi:MAG: type II toxin-antitoxin system RelE/ParE family toxin [Chitinophagales bacterium]|nr:type II toxin-antitoxin system RelE/ParE family toxin [Chitinophagales bacterium]
MSYAIRISKQALKELERLPANETRKISAAISDLSDNPCPVGCKKLKGEKEYLWRIRVGNYRVIYSIEDSVKVIEVRKIGDRKNVNL